MPEALGAISERTAFTLLPAIISLILSWVSLTVKSAFPRNWAPWNYQIILLICNLREQKNFNSPVLGKSEVYRFQPQNPLPYFCLHHLSLSSAHKPEKNFLAMLRHRLPRFQASKSCIFRLFPIIYNSFGICNLIALPSRRTDRKFVWSAILASSSFFLSNYLEFLNKIVELQKFWTFYFDWNSCKQNLPSLAVKFRRATQTSSNVKIFDSSLKQVFFNVVNKKN